MKDAGAAPTAPNPPESNLNPLSGDDAEGVVVGTPDAEVDVEADGSEKENCGPDGAADGAAERVDEVEKEKVGAGFTTSGGAGAGAGVSMLGDGFA